MNENNNAYPLAEWKLFFAMQVFWTNHFMISTIINTLQDICLV